MNTGLDGDGTMVESSADGPTPEDPDAKPWKREGSGAARGTPWTLARASEQIAALFVQHATCDLDRVLAGSSPRCPRGQNHKAPVDGGLLTAP